MCTPEPVSLAAMRFSYIEEMSYEKLDFYLKDAFMR